MIQRLRRELAAIAEFHRDNPFIRYGAPWRRGMLLRVVFLLLAACRTLAPRSLARG
ncbi:MAG: hypothetical protein SF028_01620 [Candidatus Sumerlaeia bacterium]|nr:hypothetical protein [Candidatus Sumerlaeia bacterium]